MNKLKTIMVIFVFFYFSEPIVAQNGSIEPGVYEWLENNEEIENKLLFAGSVKDLDSLRLYAMFVHPQEKLVLGENDLDFEKMIIFKNGKSKLSFGKTEKILGPGSIAIIYPDEKYEIENVGDENVEYYLFKYTSKEPVDTNRNENGLKSFYVDWDTLKFQPHDKGGLRQYCERSTAMFNYFSMHVTTLNPGIKSHEPHTHKSDEMVIMISGNTNMEIGDQEYNASNGDVYFLGADIPHAISNTDKESCMYYAFHWE